MAATVLRDGYGLGMSAARPSEGAHTAAAGEGIPVRAARPPEGAHTVAESEGAPVSAGQRHAARIPAHAVPIHADGGIGPLRCAAIEVAPPASGEVQVRPHAIGINYLDTCRPSGLFPLPPLPSALGVEDAGGAVALGKTITRRSRLSRASANRISPGAGQRWPKPAGFSLRCRDERVAAMAAFIPFPNRS